MRARLLFCGCFLLNRAEQIVQLSADPAVKQGSVTMQTTPSGTTPCVQTDHNFSQDVSDTCAAVAHTMQNLHVRNIKTAISSPYQPKTIRLVSYNKQTINPKGDCSFVLNNAFPSWTTAFKRLKWQCRTRTYTELHSSWILVHTAYSIGNFRGVNFS